jgi:hypothetical protein
VFGTIILYLLLFVFGWASCLLFYFGKSLNFYAQVVNLSQLLSLFILARSMEHFAYAKGFRIKTMIDNGDSEHNITATELQFEDEINFFKESAIKELIAAQDPTPSLRKFDNWDAGMTFLATNIDLIKKFMNKHKGES